MHRHGPVHVSPMIHMHIYIYIYTRLSYKGVNGQNDNVDKLLHTHTCKAAGVSPQRQGCLRV